VFVPDVPHHDIDEGVLDETEEHEDGAGGHEHVYSLHPGFINLRDSGQRFFARKFFIEHA
jgi:hypothetical protein